MLHSYVRNYLHITWSVKNRIKVFDDNSKIQIKDYILKKSKELNCPILAINTQPEHIHILLDLPANLCLSDFVQKVKGASSHWVNQQRIISGKLSWQRGYGAFSVSSSHLDIVKKYIRNQDIHHKIRTFEEEYEEWKNNYGFYDN